MESSLCQQKCWRPQEHPIKSTRWKCLDERTNKALVFVGCTFGYTPTNSGSKKLWPITARRGSLLQQQLHLSLPSTPGRRGSADQAISIQTLLVARPTSNAVFRSSSYIGKRRHIVAILTLGLPQGHNRHSARDATITLCLCTGRRIPLPLLLGASFAS
jgi:hypothetical protein